MLKIATSTSPRRFAYAPTHSFVSKSQGIHKGYSTAIMSFFFSFHLFMLIILVFGYTEYKGKQKEIFDAAINGV